MLQSTWRKSSPASYFRKSANSTEAPRLVERRSPRMVPGNALRAWMRNNSSFRKKVGSKSEVSDIKTYDDGFCQFAQFRLLFRGLLIQLNVNSRDIPMRQ